MGTETRNPKKICARPFLRLTSEPEAAASSVATRAPGSVAIERPPRFLTEFFLLRTGSRRVYEPEDRPAPCDMKPDEDPSSLQCVHAPVEIVVVTKLQ